MAFWITFIRGILALVLGAVLIFQPDKALPMLANFMGLYWLTSGVIGLRWGAAGGRARGLAMAAGAAGVLAGLAVAGGTVHIFVYILGTIMVLTGLLHIFEGLPTGRRNPSEPGDSPTREISRTRSWTSVLLGVFEVVLGALLILNPVERGLGVYLAAAIWALLGGFILIGDSLRLRRQRQQQDPEATHNDETQAVGEK